MLGAGHVRRRLLAVGAGVALGLAAAASIAGAANDLGQAVQELVFNRQATHFGVGRPLTQSSGDAVGAAEASANPLRLVTLAQGLRARVVASGLEAANVDMMVLWPDDSVNATHIIACNEQGATQPGVIRIDLKTGVATTIVTGTVACDGVRSTPWGTIIFSEEAGGGPSGGRVYELIRPLETTGVTLNRATGVFSGGTGAANLVVRPALGRLSFEGFALYQNGVMYYGDEQRPGNGTPGGAYFKFIPATRWTPGAPAITSLDQSPFTSGSIFGLRLGKRSGNTDYGQGTQTGLGVWVPIPAAADPDRRAQAAALKLTGFYRPEDIDLNEDWKAAGKVLWCGANTGNEADDQHYGEVVCLQDGTIEQAATNTAVPEVQLLVVGHPGLAMPDNMAWQPGRGNWIVMEDADTDYPANQTDNNDMWSCAPDGQDENLLSDGCVRIATLNDPTAEWTGGFFNADGRKFYVSIQHNITGKGVVLEITGWR